MKNSIFAALAAVTVVSAGPVLAQDEPAAPTTTVRDGDDDLTCRQMADEAAELSAGMGEHDGGLLGKVRTVAETGAAILVPGAGLAMAGADALTTSGSERREATAETRRDRWNYLNGLYAGKGCDAPETTEVAEATASSLDTPAPTVSPTPAPVTAPSGIPAPSIVPGALPR